MWGGLMILFWEEGKGVSESVGEEVGMEVGVVRYWVSVCFLNICEYLLSCLIFPTNPTEPTSGGSIESIEFA